jgi:predicted ATP-binding protein involved in virulence
MKVKRLKMQAFRGIGDLTLEFDTDEPIVFIGINGVGKSSILDCLAILLSRFTSSLQHYTTSQHYKASGRSFREEDITNSDNETHNEIQTNLNQQEVTWSLAKAKKTRSKDTSSNLSELRSVVESIHDELADNPDTNLSVVVYYAVNRAVIDIPLRIRKKHSFEPIDAYEQALGGGVDFRIFFEWFRSQEDIENELINEWWNNNLLQFMEFLKENNLLNTFLLFWSESNKNLKADEIHLLVTNFLAQHEDRKRLQQELQSKLDIYRDRQLTAVRDAIYSLIPGFSNLRVHRSPLRMTVIKQGEELIVNQLSDGEKCLLAMAGDLARRLAIANPGLSNPLEGSGVVLIDEIELHLHPKWQREIIPALTRTFPNCQFIVTTHSPQVISEVKPESVYILEKTDEGVVAKRPESSFGRDSNRILEDLMGVPERPLEIKESLLKLFRLIDQGELDAARELRQHLADEIGADEPEFVKADVFIRRKEVLNR